jgi:hypothetical protein
MTTSEKFNAIMERLKGLGEGFTPQHLSIIVINGYISVLTKKGVVTDGQYDVTQRGKDLIAICEEFEWEPSDQDIAAYVRDMVTPSSRKAFATLLARYRDDREALFKDIKKTMGNSGAESN